MKYFVVLLFRTVLSQCASKFVLSWILECLMVSYTFGDIKNCAMSYVKASFHS